MVVNRKAHAALAADLLDSTHPLSAARTSAVSTLALASLVLAFHFNLLQLGYNLRNIITNFCIRKMLGSSFPRFSPAGIAAPKGPRT